MRAEIAEREKKLVRVNEFITVSELADILKVPATQIVAFAFKHLGLMVTINQRMDFDQIELIASEFGFVAEREEEYAASPVETVKDAPETLKFRPPVVTIMGLQFSNLLAGTIIIENVFYLPGLGRLIFQSINQRDLIVVKDVVVLLAAKVVVINFIVDLLYAVIDPRLRTAR